jgi:putative salt-induced outer membrane protein YdiY
LVRFAIPAARFRAGLPSALFAGVVLAAVLLVTQATTAGAQILNTLRGFKENEPGWSGIVDASFSATGGNTEVLSLNGSGQVQYREARERFRLMASGTRKTSRGAAIEEASAAHLRHNHAFNPWLSSVAFIQHQRNPFQRLETRLLFGLGARFDLLRATPWRLAVGATPMLEIERIKSRPGTDDDLRLSTFVVLDARLNDTVTLQVTSFVQPRFSDFGDLRSMATGGVRVKLGGGFSLTTASNVEIDTRPPAGVKKTDWEVTTGLGVSF